MLRKLMIRVHRADRAITGHFDAIVLLGLSCTIVVGIVLLMLGPLP